MAGIVQLPFCIFKASTSKWMGWDMAPHIPAVQTKGRCMRALFVDMYSNFNAHYIFAEKHTSRTIKSHSSGMNFFVVLWEAATFVLVVEPSSTACFVCDEADRVPPTVWFAVWGALRPACDPRWAMPFLIAIAKAPQVIAALSCLLWNWVFFIVVRVYSSKYFCEVKSCFEAAKGRVG